MNERYVGFTISQFSDLMKACGFERNDQADCFEAIFERKVTLKSGKEYPCKVRIYSTVDIRTGETRDNGKDAIRLQLINDAGEYMVGAESRVYRTKNAFDNTLARARELFKVVVNNQCKVCANNNRFGVMVERSGKNGPFKSCSNFRANNCKNTEEIAKSQTF